MIDNGKILQQRYRIDGRIGQGGMGAVYVATDQRFGSIVAIKETLCMDDNYRRALEREARLLNSLKHVALPRVSDHFIEENGQFLVMEYIPGEDLSHTLETTDEPFPIELVIKWADQLLEALEYLHGQANPVVHRDIKPQNLKLTADGQIVLLDFGLAKGNPTGAGNQTATKSIFGYSRNYASIEQIQGTGTDPRSDLYSLAATLYHLATNIPPEDALTRAMAVLNGDPDPLVPADALNKAIPSGFAAILESAMSLNASGRPSSAAEMRAMVSEYERYSREYEGSPIVPEPSAGILLQKTKLMPQTTRHAEPQTNIKTEVLPSNDSAETRVAANRQRRRGVKAFAVSAAAAVIVAFGAAWSLGYLPINAEVPETNTVETVSPAEPAMVETVPEALPANSTVVTVEAVPPPVDTSKTERTQRVERPVRKAASQPGETLSGEWDEDEKRPVVLGNMKVVGDTVETPDVLIDDNGIRFKKKRGHRASPNNLGPYVDPEKLTPEQRQKLRVLRNIRVPNFPVPRPPQEPVQKP